MEITAQFTAISHSEITGLEAKICNQLETMSVMIAKVPDTSSEMEGQVASNKPAEIKLVSDYLEDIMDPGKKEIRNIEE